MKGWMDFRKFPISLGLVILVLAAAANLRAGDLYVYSDVQGNVFVTHTPQPDKGKTLVSRYHFAERRKEDLSTSLLRYSTEIQQAASKYGVEEELIRAVIKAESDYDPYAISEAGAIGLMQLMPETAKKLNVEDPFQPGQNIDGGAHYLMELQKKFGDPKLAVAAYHAGENRVAEYGGVPPIPSTRQYVDRVLRYYQDYKKILHRGRKIYKVRQSDGEMLYTTTPSR
jgi:hypothetical protein